MKWRVGIVCAVGAMGLAVVVAVASSVGGKTSNRVSAAGSPFYPGHSLFIVPVPAAQFHMLR
jgi:hypothetical protein